MQNDYAPFFLIFLFFLHTTNDAIISDHLILNLLIRHLYLGFHVITNVMLVNTFMRLAKANFKIGLSKTDKSVH